MMRKLLILFLIFNALAAYSQQMADSVHRLATVEVIADRISSNSAGMQVRQIDSLTRKLYSATTLSKLISEQSSVYIRSYGPGGTASLTFRGLQTSQSVVLWEGINLNSPTHGMMDISMVPVFILDQISLQYGGGSMFSGSGAIGGSLVLSGKECFSQPLKVQARLAAGSFGNISPAVKISLGNRKFCYSSSLIANSADNSYPYINLDGKRKTFQHAAYQSLGTIHKAEWKISEHQTVSAAGWYQASSRDIPPTMVMSKSMQHQSDRALRMSLQWKWLNAEHRVVSGVALTREYLHYTDGMSGIDAEYRNRTYSSHIEYKYVLTPLLVFDAGISGRLLVAETIYYNGIKNRPEAAGYASVIKSFPSAGWKVAANLRQDAVEGYRVPFCPSLGAEGRLVGRLDARLNVSRNFRVPTLNDRFWMPGGNPDLKPESSLNAEAGLAYRSGETKSPLSWKVELSGYSVLVDDLILWIPSGGSTLWSPQNIEEVWSRGVEASGSLRLTEKKLKSELSVNYTYSPSTVTCTATALAEKNGKQLIYTPLHTIKSNFMMQFHDYTVQLQNTFESRRFTQEDNRKWLPAHTLLNISAGRVLKIWKKDFTIQLDINNLLNSSYQAVQYYPAPGISFTGSITAEF
ncbi:MAG TPA: TonB-dependent receptor [Bacteroidales bacterium]|nr:TonB-dependent receptor [Bacteroidales bacterium]